MAPVLRVKRAEVPEVVDAISVVVGGGRFTAGREPYIRDSESRELREQRCEESVVAWGWMRGTVTICGRREIPFERLKEGYVVGQTRIFAPRLAALSRVIWLLVRHRYFSLV